MFLIFIPLFAGKVCPWHNGPVSLCIQIYGCFLSLSLMMKLLLSSVFYTFSILKKIQLAYITCRYVAMIHLPRDNTHVFQHVGPFSNSHVILFIFIFHRLRCTMMTQMLQEMYNNKISAEAGWINLYSIHWFHIWIIGGKKMNFTIISFNNFFVLNVIFFLKISHFRIIK